MPCGRRSLLLLRIMSNKSLEDVKKQGLKKRCPIRVAIMNTFTLETGNTTVISTPAERWLSERVECAAGAMSFLRYDRVEFLVWISAESYSMLRTFVQLTLTTAFSESSTRWIPDIFLIVEYLRTFSLTYTNLKEICLEDCSTTRILHCNPFCFVVSETAP